MTTTKNIHSSLYQLRALMPRRSLRRSEAFRLAELQANHVLAQAGIHGAGTPDVLVTGLPFMEVRLIRNLPGGASGVTQWRKPRWIVLLNKDEPALRRRFSLWHEFKHIIDHEGVDRMYRGFTHREVEIVADYFAACVLMPRRFVKRLFGQGHQDAGELAAMFGVSEVAMRRRLKDLGLAGTTRYERCARPIVYQTSRPVWATAA